MSNYPYHTFLLQHPENGKTFPLEMVKVEGGTFKMGSNKYEREKPIHTVTVPTFYIGKYPVTQRLYEFVLGKAANRSRFQSQDRPVENVSWNDTQTFLQQLNQKFSKHKNFRLPSEAEWEYAARGGKHWRDGFEYAGSNEVNEVAWGGWGKDENSHKETFSVGFKKPNQLGIYDMSGNVWEWCEDDWHKNYKGGPKDGSAWVDTPRDDWRVVRGSSWADVSSICRVSYRNYRHPSDRYYLIGFRLVVPQF